MVERTAAGRERASWDSERVRRLRRHLDETQGELAERLGTRQQTVSEWETGHSRPRRMSQRLLRMVAEESGFYAAEPPATEANPPSTNPLIDEQRP